jgi:hypothetical protein
LNNLRIPFLAIILAGILVVAIKILLAPEIEPPKQEEETPGAIYLPPLKNYLVFTSFLTIKLENTILINPKKSKCTCKQYSDKYE